MKRPSPSFTVRAVAGAILAGHALAASADVVTDWNIKANDLVAESKLGTPPAIRVMTLVQSAVFDAVNVITQRYPSRTGYPEAQTASVDAAVAAANRAVLLKLLPAQQAAIEDAYSKAMATIADGPHKTNGATIGEKAAAALLAARAVDSVTAESYRPHTTPGAYVPTALPAVPTWPQRTPWAMSSASQFRAAPPPQLTSVAWARDFNEVKELGSKSSGKRTAEQTEIGRFWEYSLPGIYHGVLRSVALQPQREVTRNARLLAVASQAMDDAMIGVFEAKYHYNFWRPATAIRNGDIDGNDATAREANWTPLIDAPLHPEYPSAHATLAAAVGAVLQADVGRGRMPQLATASPTAKGAVRRWSSVDDFVREVGESRIYAGIHYRTSVDAGTKMGAQIGELAASRQPDALMDARDTFRDVAVDEANARVISQL